MLIIFFFISNNSFAKIYESCGQDRDEALDDLVSQISVTVESKYEESAKMLSKGDDQETQQSTLRSLTKRSKLQLRNVTYSKRNSKFCASVDSKSLLLTAKALLDTLLRFKLSNLPKGNLQAVQQLEEWNSDYKVYKRYELLFSNKLSKRKKRQMARIAKEVMDRLVKTYTQSVTFNVKGKSIVIAVDDQFREIRPGQEFFLKQGKHSYLATGRDYCIKVENFDLKKNERKKIDLDLEKYRIPELTFTSNQLNHAVELTVNGKRYSIGKTWKGDRNHCNKVVPYQFEFEGQVEKGTITLKAGLKKVINENFLSMADRSKIFDRFHRFYDVREYSTYLQLGYAYGTPASGFADAEDYQLFEISKLSGRKGYLVGYGIHYGHKEGEYLVKALLKARLLLRPDAKWKLYIPFIKLPFSPFVAVNVGLGVHCYKKLDSDRSCKFTEDEKSVFSEFASNYIVSRLKLGLMIPINTDLGVEIHGSKAFTMAEDIQVGIGILIKL